MILEKMDCIVIVKEGTGEVIEKRSRFISKLCAVQTVEQADAIIKDTKKKYHDARHVCFAYNIEGIPPTLRFSDDGEPSGTAGKPMLDVIEGEHLTNALFLCVRYFGGTLLGTGGLVRAYQGAAKKAYEDAKLGKKIDGIRVQIRSSYEDNGKIQYLIEKKGFQIEFAEYLEEVKNIICIPIQDFENLKNEVIEITAARAKIKKIEVVSIVKIL